MSILLESLEQKKSSSNDKVPNLGDSHFDDEMLNDDGLVKQIKRWQQIAAGLLFLLVISWIYFLFLSQHNSNSVDADALLKQSQAILKPLAQEPRLSAPVGESTAVNIDPLIPSQTLYKPRKIDQNNSPKNNENPRATKSKGLRHKTDPSRLALTAAKDLSKLVINSYAISSNSSKSVVVINGSFYAQGESISPNIKLIEITKDGIKLEHNGRIVFKNYP